MAVPQVAPLTCTWGLQSPTSNCNGLQRSACSPLFALWSNSSTSQLSARLAVSYLCSAIVFHRKHMSCFLGLFLYFYVTVELSLSLCTPQFCSLSLREEDSTAVQLGHAGRDGPGSWAEIRKSSPHFEFEISSAPEVLILSCRLWKRTAKHMKKKHSSHDCLYCPV